MVGCVYGYPTHTGPAAYRQSVFLEDAVDKPYKSIDEQIALLESRGVLTDKQTGSILLREGYYSVVNGYKTPFINAAATDAAQDDRYIDGTRFADLHALFLFDRNLRETTFHHLIRVEALVRTVCRTRFPRAIQALTTT